MVLNRLGSTDSAGVSSRRPRRNRFVTALAAVLLASASVVAAPAVAAQECSGTISATVSAESLPGGTWAVEGGCLNAESYFQYVDGPVLAKAGISTVTYTDGHQGRVAAGVLTLGNGIGLGLVGVEDSATGLIKWSAVLGEFNDDGGIASVNGQGVALFPVERADISASFTGTGTDVAPLLEGADQPDLSEPDSTGVDTTVESTVPESTAPQPEVPASTVPEPDASGSDSPVPGAAVEPDAVPSTTPTTIPPRSGDSGSDSPAFTMPAASPAPGTQP